MNSLYKNIENQIDYNKGKNIFQDNLNIFQFSKETQIAITNLSNSQITNKQAIIEFTGDRSIREFCRINQYYSFDSQVKSELLNIYLDLFDKILNNYDTLDVIAKKHYINLKQLLVKSNSFAGKLYKNASEIITPIPCSEYLPELQIDILKIDINHLVQPVLDIGCGSKGYLVKYLSNKGIDVYGVDRFQLFESNLLTSDWLEYNYEEKKWGTIISNLGFSNHFNHHNLRIDGNYIEYAKVYKKILNALKIGGQFHYAPDLPFIEQYIDQSNYSITHYMINNLDLSTVVIKRLK